jgi:hypothetical protein
MIRISVLSLLLLAFSQASNSATLDFTGAGLMGASGVNVNGSIYNVQFLPGSCVSTYAGCDDIFDFTFHSGADADAASQALLDQVINAYITVDRNPGVMNGVGSSVSGEIYTPWGRDESQGIVTYDYVRNHIQDPFDTNFCGIGECILPNPNSFFGPNTPQTWAKWTEVSPVPVPAAIWLFGTGILGLIGFSKRRKSA